MQPYVFQTTCAKQQNLVRTMGYVWHQAAHTCVRVQKDLMGKAAK
jgi:hypothetical protein